MKTSANTRSVQVTTLVLATAIAVFGLSKPAWADSLPAFSDPAVNTFVKTYSQFVDSYVDAAKTGDTARLTAIQAKESELQQQLGQLTQPNGKVKPDEVERFQNFLATYKDKILPYYKYSAADVNTFVTRYAQFVESYIAGTKSGDAAKLAATREREFQQQAIQAAGKLRKVEGKLFLEDTLFPEFLATYTQKIASYIALSYKYIDDSINTFAEKYSKFVDDYVAAMQAAKSGDTSKLTSIQNEATDIQAQAVPTVKKVKDGETAIFQSFIAQEIARISEASK